MASRRRSGLRASPHKVKKASDGKGCWWWYEERGRITIVHEIHVGGQYVRTDTCEIRAASLSGYLDRLRRVR